MKSETQISNDSLKASSTKTLFSEFIAAATASQLDTLIHPVNTVVTRLQNHGPIHSVNELKEVALTQSEIPNAVQLSAAGTSKKTKIKSLWSGVGASAVQKLLARSLRFVGQGHLQQQTQSYLEPLVQGHASKETVQTLSGGLAGVEIGVLESIFFHPLDTIKICQQVGKKPTFGGLYQGFNAALGRNVLASCVFFSVYNGWVSHNKNEQPSMKDNFLGSTLAGVTNTVILNPWHVIKSRMQTANHKTTMAEMALNLFRLQGIRAFASGLGTKLLIQTPVKAIGPFLMFQLLKDYLQKKSAENVSDAPCKTAAIPTLTK